LLVAALFAFHPFNVESVAWVAERKNVLSTLFFFLAVAAYVRYAQKPDWRRYLLVATLFAAGLMAKPMVITLPFVLLLLDYWPLGRTMGSPACAVRASQFTVSRLLLEKIPLLVLSAASAWITLKAQRAAIRTLHQSPLAVRIENSIVSYGLYLWKMLWPGRLAALYPYPTSTLPVWQVTLSALMLLVVTALVVVFRRKRYLPVGWFWFLGTLIPVIGVVPVGGAAMADRYAYIPLIGIFVMIAWGLEDWAGARKISTVWRVIPALCVLTALAAATSRQLGYWDNDYDLWSQALAVNEQTPFAHDALALFLVEPGAAAALNQRANLDTKQKLMVEARRHFERAVELRRQLTQQNPAYLPDMALALRNLANLDLVENRMEEASRHYEEALEIDRQLAQQDPGPYLPDMAGMLMNLGSLERSQKQPDKADLHFEEAVKIDRQLAQQDPDKYLPDMASRLLNLGNFDTEQNRMDEARPHYEEALKIYRQLARQDPDMYLPDVAGTLSNLAVLDESQNKIEECRVHYTETMTIYRKLAQGNPARYAGEVARVEASLEKLDKKRRSQ
jgi:tetratricopeptide (TPR) repeat protein